MKPVHRSPARLATGTALLFALSAPLPALAQEKHYSQTVSVEGVFGVVEAGLAGGGVSHAFRITHGVQALGSSNVQRDIQARFINDGIDLVRDEGLATQLHADVTADLPDPHRLTFDGNGCQP